MKPLTDEQLILKRRHGTPREFENACMECLGKISVAEMQAAVNKYRAEWRHAGRKRKPKRKPDAVNILARALCLEYFRAYYQHHPVILNRTVHKMWRDWTGTADAILRKIGHV